MIAKLEKTLVDLAPCCIDKYLGFLWALIVLPWLQIYSCFCYERDFMMSLSDDKQVAIIDTFNTTSR